MSGASVLYDVPGPKAKTRNRVYTVLGTLAVLGLIAFAVLRLSAKGQLEPEVWNIFNNAGVRTNIRDGVLTTLQVFAVAAVLSLILGVLLAVARLSDHKPVRWLSTGFIELFRAVPLLITIYALWVIFLTNRDSLGLTGSQPQFWALVVGLTIYNGSVQAEVLRAGINSVPKGQREAAYALGMSKTQVMTTVLIPQAVRAMLPTIISQLVVTLKDTSLGYIITFEELLFTRPSDEHQHHRERQRHLCPGHHRDRRHLRRDVPGAVRARQLDRAARPPGQDRYRGDHGRRAGGGRRRDGGRRRGARQAGGQAGRARPRAGVPFRAARPARQPLAAETSRPEAVAPSPPPPSLDASTRNGLHTLCDRAPGSNCQFPHVPYVPLRARGAAPWTR